jgi:dihydroxyacetone kinase DhaKLM complex PTS-EIIA-like component DhaM
MVEKKRRIKVDLRIELLSLKICDNNLTDPLVKISAEKTRIHARLLPDQDQLKSEIILHNLICEDVRLKSTNRQFKDLISQTCHGEQNKESSDVFVVSWAKDNRQNMTDISLKVGSPRIVFVPDTIAGILRFLKSEDSGRRDRQTRGRVDELTSEGIEVDFDKHGDAIETSFVEEKAKLSLSLVTGDCSIVLVDMGSSALSEVVVTRALNEKGYKTQATESIVLQGSFTANVKTETEVNSGKIERVDLDLHGNRAEGKAYDVCAWLCYFVFHPPVTLLPFSV